jgi:signal peptidase I
MVPTLLVGDELIGSKFAYGYGKYSSPIGLMPDFSGRLFGEAPERGDVIVFRLPRDPSTTYVKRLIGLPGDRIQMQGGRLYINGAIVPRRAIGPFANDVGGRGIASTLYVETLPNGREHELVEISDAEEHDDTPSFVVPPKHYFMMGDNRDNSLDSRIAAEDGVSSRKTIWSPAPIWSCCHAIRPSAGSTWRNGRTHSGSQGCSATSTSPSTQRHG